MESWSHRNVVQFFLSLIFLLENKQKEKKRNLLYLCIVAMSSWHHFESWKVTGDEFDFVNTSANALNHHGQQSAILCILKTGDANVLADFRPTRDRLFSDYQPTVDRLQADRRPTVGSGCVGFNASIRSDSIPFPTELL